MNIKKWFYSVVFGGVPALMGVSLFANEGVMNFHYHAAPEPVAVVAVVQEPPVSVVVDAPPIRPLTVDTNRYPPIEKTVSGEIDCQKRQVSDWECTRLKQVEAIKLLAERKQPDVRGQTVIVNGRVQADVTIIESEATLHDVEYQGGPGNTWRAKATVH